jgi:hypothetical protein
VVATGDNPLSEEAFLVSYTDSFVKNDDHRGTFNLYFMLADGGRELLARDDYNSCTHAKLLAPRAKPPSIPRKADYTKSTGVFSISDVYFGQSMPNVPRGSADKIRVIALDYPHYNTEGSSSIRQGRFGSMRTPVYFQVIDTVGQMIQTMRSWSTLQPGETFACFGCHESRLESTPPPATPPLAMLQPPQVLERNRGFEGEGFSYLKFVQPILNERCIRCHDDLPIEYDGRERKQTDTTFYRIYSMGIHSLPLPHRTSDKTRTALK